MTTNQLIQCGIAKEATISGVLKDATPFTENSKNVADKLVKDMEESDTSYGFSPYGWETMYDGRTGEMMNAKIFIGPTYYQRLKHLVSDKIHVIAKGEITTLTRQPLKRRGVKRNLKRMSLVSYEAKYLVAGTP
jgi:DNA-directed RNA polymerase II subunit RPB2